MKRPNQKLHLKRHRRPETVSSGIAAIFKVLTQLAAEKVRSEDNTIITGSHPPSIFQNNRADDQKLEMLLPKIMDYDGLHLGHLFPIHDGEELIPWETCSWGSDETSLGDEPFLFSASFETGPPPDLLNQLSILSSSMPEFHPQGMLQGGLDDRVDLFTPSNIERFFRQYFRHWHRHSPILHRQLFNPGTISMPLLLAVVLTGALFSSSVKETNLARSMLDFAEDYAFENPIFLDLISKTEVQAIISHRAVIEAVQAAMSVFQIQLREGSPQKRKYMRTVRMSQIVTVRR